MTYVDGFVAAVPTANRETYRKHAGAAAVVFTEHGALKLVECWDDPPAAIECFAAPVSVAFDSTGKPLAYQGWLVRPRVVRSMIRLDASALMVSGPTDVSCQRCINGVQPPPG